MSLSWRTNEYKSILTTMKRIQSKLEVLRLWHVRHKLISIYYISLVETLGGTPECRGAHRPLFIFSRSISDSIYFISFYAENIW
jgi:hypothetical protein